MSKKSETSDIVPIIMAMFIGFGFPIGLAIEIGFINAIVIFVVIAMIAAFALASSDQNSGHDDISQ